MNHYNRLKKTCETHTDNRSTNRVQHNCDYLSINRHNDNIQLLVYNIAVLKS